MSMIPEKFARFMCEIHGQEKAHAWLTSLPEILAHCAERWHLAIFEPFPNLSYHYAAPARRADGTPAVVKVDSPTGEFAKELAALRLFQDGCMARLLEADEEREVVLLERLLPGTPLASLVPEEDERATSIMVGVMKRVWRPVPAQHPFPTVEDWGSGLNQLNAQYQGGYGPFEPRLVEEARALFTELSTSCPRHLLLHGDMHHDNILLAGNTWRAIDAKGVVGDPGYDVGAMFYNPIGWLAGVSDPRKMLARRVDQLAEELEMDRERIRGWGLAQCILSAWWDVEDNPHAEPSPETLVCAEMLASLK